MMDKLTQIQKTFIGIALGIAIPLVTIGIINIILVMVNKYLTTSVFQASLLFGIGINAILVWFVMKGKKENFGRGMMVSSFFIFVYWVVRFMLLENK